MLFGTTATGGAKTGNCSNYTCGTAYSLAPTGKKFAVTYAFQGVADGDNPYAGLSGNAGGELFGSSASGLPVPYGQVYRLSGRPAKLTHTIVRSLTGGKDGDTPSALLLDANGTTLFGTSAGIGSGNCCGTVFQINTDGSGYRVLHYFAPLPNGLPGKDGGNPAGALVEDPATGTLYGAALTGGKIDALCQSGCGTIYELVPSKGGNYKFSVIYRFAGDKDGFNPSDRLTLGLAKTGLPTIYGVTVNGGTDEACVFGSVLSGCGTVYKLTADGTKYAKAILYSFAGAEENDGQAPTAGLTLVGSTLYGTTSKGGGVTPTSSHYGSVFSVSTEGSGYRIVHTFLAGNDGAIPSGSLTYAGGTLYGVTSEGGSVKTCIDGSIGCGSIYAIRVR
jgi:hypothetical protein